MDFWRVALLLVGVVALAGCLASSTEAVAEGFVEKKVRYDAVRGLTDVAGKLAYAGMTKSNISADGETYVRRESVIVFGREERGERYWVWENGNFDSPIEVNGTLVYWANGDRGEFVVIGGEEGRGYTLVDQLSEVNGNVAYRAREQVASDGVLPRTTSSIVYNGGKLGERSKYEPVSFPREVSGELAFVAADAGQWFIVSGGEEVGRQYANVTALREVNGSLAYKVVRGGEETVVFDGREMDQAYDHVEMDSLISVNGDLAFKAREDGQEFIVFRGKRLGENHDYVSNPVNAGGELVYSIGNESDEHPVLIESLTLRWGGDELGEQYDNVVWGGAVVDGKPAYVARDEDEGKSFVVVGNREKERYPGVDAGSIKEINGKLVYVVFGDRGDFVVYGDREIRNGYEDILAGPIAVGGELVFAAKRNGEIYIVRGA